MEKKRNTVQRQLIFDSLRELNIHATAEQVYEHVVLRHPSISKATVYRNLSQMTAAGEILNIGNFYGSTHFDHNCHDHYHMICEKCRRIHDVSGTFADVISRIEKNDEIEITNYILSFYGLCRDCK